MSGEDRAPGWYPDERYPEDERWWDGQAWTQSRPRGEHATSSRSAADVEEERREQRFRLIALVALPVGVALIYAAFALARQHLG